MRHKEAMPNWKTEANEVDKMLQHEVELAQMQKEADHTKKLIADDNRQAEEAAVVADTATARAAAHAQQAAEADRHEEARQARLREEAAKAAAHAAEAARLAAA